MDFADQARHIETRQRDQALAHHNAIKEDEKPEVRHGIRVCLDCDTAIIKRRLKAQPKAVRCVECQSDHERGGL